MNDKFAEARRLFPHTQKIVYFNSAAYCPFATPVADAVRDNVQLRVDSERDDTGMAHEALDRLRHDYAALINVDKSEIGVCGNTSAGIEIAALGLPLEAGDEVLVSEVEFPALIYGFRGAAEQRGLKLRILKSKDRVFDAESFETSLTPKSRVLALSWVQFFNGYKNDLAALGEICRRHGLFFVVDGIQGMGVEPIDVRAFGIDVFMSGCQKWMLSPQGTGFYYISREIQRRMLTPFATWHEVDWHQNYTDLFKFELPWVDDARRYQAGYYNVFGLLAMRAAVDIIAGLGVMDIQRHTHALIDRLAAYIRGNDFYRITSSMDEQRRSSIFTFTCPDFLKLHAALLKERIICVHREGSVRISVHLFNNVDDIDRLIGVLGRFAREGR